MGSAAAWCLARSGLHTVLLEALSPPHDQGSTHGESRVIREAYFEGPAYVPLVRRAYALWEELERGAGDTLLHRTGALMLGAEGSVVVVGTRRSAEAHAIPHEVLSAAEVARRFPALRPPPGMVGVLEERAGVLRVEACVRAQIAAARKAGAELRIGERYLGFTPGPDGLEVQTGGGVVSAGALVLALGPWLPEALPSLPLTVERQVMAWFAPPEAAAVRPGALPVHLWETPEGRRFYAVPDLGTGVKAALHHEGETTDPARVRREVDAADVEPLRALLDRYAPGCAGRFERGVTCLYTNTPDQDFIVDRLPGEGRVVVLSPCSGHGFKFAPAVGEAAAALVRGEEPAVPLEPFAISRFAGLP